MKEIRLKLRSFNLKKVESTVLNIIASISKRSTDIKVISIPNKILKFTVNRSPHVYKESREQFEIRHYTKVVFILSNLCIIDNLMKLEIETGVDIEVKIK